MNSIHPHTLSLTRTMFLTNSDDVVHQVHHHRIDTFNNNNNNNASASALSLDYTHNHHANTNSFSNNNYQYSFNNTSNQIYDTRTFSSHNSFDDNITSNSTSCYFLAPKLEEGSTVVISGQEATGTTRIGLNLGVHGTYFSLQDDDDFVNSLYRRSRRPGGMDQGGVNSSPRCQAEGCAADLSNAKHYHRRHKVCEFHSKAATVIAGGVTKRFCQQCSRFHLLTEFDNGKRSCRKRLADHNRRRRKTPQLPSPASSFRSHLSKPHLTI